MRTIFSKSLDKMRNMCYNIIKIREGKPKKPDWRILCIQQLMVKNI